LKLPGIGEKTAERLALHILRSPWEAAEALSRSILEIKDKIRLCSMCFSLSDTEQCRICSYSSRDRSLLCVVEQLGDMVSIEKAGAFHWAYHVLCGFLSPMDGVGPDDIRIREFICRVKVTIP
jgi:recombination protein RecR